MLVALARSIVQWLLLLNSWHTLLTQAKYATRAMMRLRSHRVTPKYQSKFACLHSGSVVLKLQLVALSASMVESQHTSYSRAYECLELTCWIVMQVCWSDDGERFAGLGDGGVVATWRLDAPHMAASDTGYLGRSDWCHQVPLLCFQHSFL